MTKPSLVIALSGGVDSSVAALRLIQSQRYDCQAVFVKNWEEDLDSSQCTFEADYQSASSICDQLDIPLHLVSFSYEYFEQVFNTMIDGYSRGLTPNPDVLCNRVIKFDMLQKWRQQMGIDWLVTGHHARLQLDDNGIPMLLRGIDDDKDQSYFLNQVATEGFRNCLFPIGELTRLQVRYIASEAGLSTADRKGSTGLCFIGERKFNDLIADYVADEPGDIVNTSGLVLGQHKGLALYTLGQRRGIGVGGSAQAQEAPWYVVDINHDDNLLVVSQDEDDLLQSTVIADDINWIGPEPDLDKRLQDLQDLQALQVKVRYRQSDQYAKVTVDGDRMTLQFEQPQRAVAPGQYVCLYDGERCLGGARIHEQSRDYSKFVKSP